MSTIYLCSYVELRLLVIAHDRIEKFADIAWYTPVYWWLLSFYLLFFSALRGMDFDDAEVA